MKFELYTLFIHTCLDAHGSSPRFGPRLCLAVVGFELSDENLVYLLEFVYVMDERFGKVLC